MSELGPRAHDEDAARPSLADVLAADRFVEAICSGELTAADATDEVLVLLVAWRDHVDAGAVPVHPDLDEAEVALWSATRGARWRLPLRVLSPVAAAAAAVGIALTGIGSAAHQSSPGDPLWGVSQALFAGHSRSVQAAANVTAELAEAETAMASGAPERARAALQRAAADLGAVGAGEGRQDLEHRHAELQARLEGTRPDGTTSDAPAPTTVARTPVTTSSTSPSVSLVPPVTTTATPRPTTDPATSTPTSTPTTVAPAVTTGPTTATDPAPSPTTTPAPAPTPTGTTVSTAGAVAPVVQPTPAAQVAPAAPAGP